LQQESVIESVALLVKQALRNQIDEHRKRATDMEEMAKAVRSGSMAQAASNKKDEDVYDLESGALLPGSSTSVKPIAGLVRKAPAPFNHLIAVNAARRVDRALAMLDKRPGARAGLLLYLLLLHFYIILW
jgi:hypothetical protein